MIDNIITRKDCTGCAVCSAVCPASCIKMNDDQLGYLYPEVEYTNCIECSKCIKVCPALDESLLSPSTSQISVAAINKDDGIWKESTSGGAFTAICDTFGDSETIIYGAKFDGITVIHDYVIGINNISVFRRSKYVHSYIKPELYNEIRSFLIEGKKVIFSGVSCQVAAVIKRLGKTYSNLLCVDIVCMGSGSPNVFHSYLNELSTIKKNKIRSYSFRNKRVRFGKMQEYNVEIIYKNEDKDYKRSDLYNTSYLSALHTMDVCQNCKYKNKNRIGDITLADFKNRVMTFPNDKDIRTLSAIIFNTDKGSSIYEGISERMLMRVVETSIIEKNVHPFNRKTKESSNRSGFINSYIEGQNVVPLMKRYNNKKSFIHKIWGNLPEKLRYKIKSLRNGK